MLSDYKFYTFENGKMSSSGRDRPRYASVIYNLKFPDRLYSELVMVTTVEAAHSNSSRNLLFKIESFPRSGLYVRVLSHHRRIFP